METSQNSRLVSNRPTACTSPCCARAAKALVDALDANVAERIAEQAVEAEFAFADEIERCTSLHYDTNDAAEAFRDTVSTTAETRCCASH